MTNRVLAALLVFSAIAAGCTSSNTPSDRPLFHAVLFEPDQIVPLIEDGEDVNETWMSGYNYSAGEKSGYVEIEQSVLSVAVRHGRTDAVSTLLDNGADPNLGASDVGYTPLAWAVRVQDVEMVRDLLDAGADSNLRIKSAWDDGEYPIFWAVRQNNQVLTELLIAHGADPNVRDNNGESPLAMAERWDRQKLAQLLTDGGATLRTPAR